MSRVKYVNKVFRLKKAMDLTLPGVPQVMPFRVGEEFHIVADMLYMNGFPLQPELQARMINWIESNPNLFVDDTRNF